MKFKATLESTGTALRWVMVPVPFDISRVWPERNGRRVRGEINGFEFQTSLFPNARDGGYSLLVNKQMQKGGRTGPGQTAQFRLEPDLEERPAEAGPELARALREAAGLRKWFDALNPSMRRDIARWVSQPKGKEGRVRRAEQMAESLLLAKEGESELPPILRLAFERQPDARAGWEAMSSVRRRRHLFGIFFHQTPAGREKRAQAAVVDALTLARRKK